MSQKPSQILENLKMALPAVVSHVMGGWDNVQSFHIKTNSSVSLPIWNCELGGGKDGRWGDLDAGEQAKHDSIAEPSSEDESESDEDEVPEPELAMKRKKIPKKESATKEERVKKKAKTGLVDK